MDHLRHAFDGNSLTERFALEQIEKCERVRIDDETRVGGLLPVT